MDNLPGRKMGASLPLRVVLLTLFITLVILSTAGGQRQPIETVFKWKTIAYGPTDKSEKDLIGGHPYYIRGNIIPTAIAYHEKTSVMFIAAPRIKPGVIATLNSLDLFETFHLSSPIWTPYPNAQFNELKPWHFPREEDYEGSGSSEFEESSDCQENWKKGPGFCKGYYQDDHFNIPDEYLPEKFLSSSEHHHHHHHRRRPHHHKYRQKRSYNETNIKIRISSSFPQSDSVETDGQYSPLSAEEDSLRIGLRTVRHLKTLISVNSLLVDRCDRLWFIDTGVLDYGETGDDGEQPLTVQRPSIWVVDISTKDLFLIQRRFEFRGDTVPTPSGLRSFTVDVRTDSCDSYGVAYIANALDNRIVVYDMQKEDAWYFEDHQSMAPIPGYSSHLQFPRMAVDVSLGITDLAIGWRDSDRGHSIYYMPFSSEDLFVVSTRSLKRSEVDQTSEEAFKYVGSRGERSQTESIVFDRASGVLLFAEVQTRSVKCWNVRKRLTRSNIGTVLESPNLEYPAHVSLDSAGVLWVLSNNYPVFHQDGFRHDRYHMHLFRIVLKEVIKNTVCE